MLAAQPFVKPYPQATLDGALGLTSFDLATSLGIRHADFVKDLRARRYVAFLQEAGFRFGEFSPNRKGPGRRGVAFAFDVAAAKAIVASSRTALGAGYMRYLLDCERRVGVAEDLVPKLQAIIEEQAAQIRELSLRLAALEQPRRVPARRSWKVVVGYRTERMLGLNGEREARVPVIREIPLDNMTDEERRVWESRHLSRISAGASRKAEKLLGGEAEPGKVRQLPARPSRGALPAEE